MEVLEKINILTTFKIITCCKCSFPFAVTAVTKEKWVDRHTVFHCPSCRTPQSFQGETDEDRLRKALEQTQRQLKWQTEFKEEARAENVKLRNKLNGTKGYITKIKNRVGNGVCPCCNRTFQNLKSHMNTKHPNYKTQ